jgi:AcrR family transcriptional regulator
MSREPRSRRHPHLTRASIAAAAIAIVDADGVAALSLRKVATALQVPTMTLYHYVPSRDAMVADVVARLLDEIELVRAPGLTWAEGAKAVGRSLRAMALRHPRAFELVAAAASDEPPLVDFAARLRSFYVELGAPVGAFVEVWSVLDAFETGFLLLETRALLRGSSGTHGDDLDEETSELAGRMPGTLTSSAYEEGLELIVGGLERRLLRSRPPSEAS